MLKHLNVEELRKLNLKQLGLLDIDSPEYEALVDQVVNEKKQNAPVVTKIKTIDVPDIKSPEEEAKWQKVIDARVAATKPLQVFSEAPVDKVDQDTVEILEESPILETTQVVDKLPKGFCDKCASKGVRHLKVCPNYIAINK